MPTTRCLAASTLALALACGELADQDSKPPVIATIQGSLRLAANVTAPPGSIRLALLWRKPDYDEQSFDACSHLPSRPYVFPMDATRSGDRRLLLGSIQRAIDITPQFPSAFTLEITEPAPAEAMYVDDDGVRIAEGELVVYRDGNGNGKLDPRTDEGPSPDEVLSADLNQSYYGLLSRDPNVDGRPWGYAVWFLDRPRTYTATFDLHAGYNLIGYGRQFASVVEQAEIELLPTPATQAMLCTDECVTVDVTPYDCPANPAASLPKPPSSALDGYRQSGKGSVWSEGPNKFVFDSRYCFASQGGYEFRWERMEAAGCTQRREVSCSYGPLPAPSPDWPCDSYLDWRTLR